MLQASHFLGIQSSNGTSYLTSANFFASWQLAFGRNNAPRFERFRSPKILILVWFAAEFQNLPDNEKQLPGKWLKWLLFDEYYHYTSQKEGELLLQVSIVNFIQILKVVKI